jgi:hypothetical protein
MEDDQGNTFSNPPDETPEEKAKHKEKVEKSLGGPNRPGGPNKNSQQQQGQQEQQSQEQCDGAAAPPKVMGQQQQVQQQEQQGQQEQQQRFTQQQCHGQITDADTDAFVDGKVDIKDLKTQLKSVVDSKSIEDFVDGLTDMDQLLKKTASGRTADDQGAGSTAIHKDEHGLGDLEPLADMAEENVGAFLQKMQEAGKKLLSQNDIEKFMEGLNAFYSEAEQAGKGITTSSVNISMTTLVRLAHANPDARPVLLGMIIEAAKKKKKKDKRKKDKADKKKDKGKAKGKKPNPFAKGGDKAKDKGKTKGKGKKAPPFGGKKAPPFGKKKSSVEIDSSDTKW